MWSRKGSKSKRQSTVGPVDGALLPPGIINSANDCFANSVLQSLIATSKLEDMILFRTHVGEHTSGDPALSPALTNGRTIAGTYEHEFDPKLVLSDAFIKFMEDAYRARGNKSARALNPRDIIRALGQKFDQYLDFRQQDAQELLCHLLDAMYMDEKDIVKKRQPPVDPKLEQKQARRRSRGRPPSIGRSSSSGEGPKTTPSDPAEDVPLEPFSATIFGGRLASFIVCDTCKKISHTYEDIMDLSLPIRAEDMKKKGGFRNFVHKFVIGLPQTSPSSAIPSRPSTPAPAPVSSTSPSATAAIPIPSSDHATPNTLLTTPEPILRVDSPMPIGSPGSTTLGGDSDSGYVSQLGRSVSLRINRSRERMMDSLKTSGGNASGGSRPGSRSRPTSRDTRVGGGSSTSVRKVKKSSTGPRKTTPGEAAYLRALLRDEASQSNPLALLRGGVPPVSSSSPYGPTSPTSSSTSSATHFFGRSGASTSLVDCLRMFTSVEVLENDNAFACHNCWKLAHPDVASRQKHQRGRRRANGQKNDADDDSSSSSSSDPDECGDDGVSEAEEDEVHSARERRNGKFLRPDFAGARTTSADGGLLPASRNSSIPRPAMDSDRLPSFRSAATSSPALSPNGSLLTLEEEGYMHANPHGSFPNLLAVARQVDTSDPNALRALPPLPPSRPMSRANSNGPGVPSASSPPPAPLPPAVPFPVLNIPSISTSLPSPESPSPPPLPRSLSRSHSPLAFPMLDHDELQAQEAAAHDQEAEPVPRFRRFSSFHAEKFLMSPNISRESLVSAPPDEGLHYANAKQRSGLGASRPPTPGGAVYDTEEDVDERSTVPESATTSQTDISLGPSGGPSSSKEEGYVRLPDADHANGIEPPPGQASTLGPLLSMSERTKHASWSASAAAPSLSLPTTSASIAQAQGEPIRSIADAAKRLSSSLDPSQSQPAATAAAAASPEPGTVKRADQVILRTAFKRYLIDRPPPVLVVHLKRFQQVHKSGSSTLFAGTAKKLEDYVSFPEFLDVRPFLAPRKEKYGLNERGRTPKRDLVTGGVGAKAAKKLGGHGHHHHHHGWGASEDDEPPVMYRLYAVVVHIGSMLGGHYIAYTALPERGKEGTATRQSSDPTSEREKADDHRHRRTDSTPSRQWCYVSDTSVRLASLDEVLKQKAYLLFYERIPRDS